MALPILYSYRRCPYAMRARMALKYASIEVEIREISLHEKPEHMLQLSPKATVPVLVLLDGQVIDESMDIMYWALKQTDIKGWLKVDKALTQELIAENDTSFKCALDGYKYPEKHTVKTQRQHRIDGEIFLHKLEVKLQQNNHLLSAQPSLADIAIFPFIRQFAAVDYAWFETADYPRLRRWLRELVESELFVSIMQKQPTYLK